MSLAAYFSFTKQDEKWIEISNEIILNILKSYKKKKKTDEIITFDIGVYKAFWNFSNISELERLLNLRKVKNLKELEDILKDADSGEKMP